MGCLEHSLLPFGLVAVEEQLAEFFETFDSAHLVVQLGVNRQVEVVVDLRDLSQVFVLHLASVLAFAAVLAGVGVENLVDHDVVDVDFLLC
jgi:hypothetical protein